MNDAARHLVRRLTDRLSILPILGAQLRDTAQQVEHSVVSVCASFQQIATRAREAVTLAREGLAGQHSGGRARAGMDDAVHAARQTLDRLLTRVVKHSELSQESAARMAQLEGSLNQIGSILNDIDKMARATRILALNAAIEAARFGAEGRSFGVVAKEIQQVAGDSNRTSVAIRQILTQVVRDAADTSTDLQHAASLGLEEAKTSRGEVESALEALAVAGHGLQQTIVEASANSERLASDINAAVMALQFQDAVGQRIGHVIESLDQMAQACAADLSGASALEIDSPEAEASDAAPLAALEASYTMWAERDAQAREAGGAIANEQQPGTIELF
ncbi:MAG TPA: methyl-accepting chemotaxis protein [Vicinamibacterales bacterium]|jgi:methyl-accepting chemotaxis protein